MLTEIQHRESAGYEGGWLAGFMGAAERALSLAKTNEEFAFAERLFLEASDAQREAYADAVYDGD